MQDEKKRNMDLEKAVLVLKRVVEKLQAENKRLYSCKVSKVQEKVSKTHVLNIDRGFIGSINDNDYFCSPILKNFKMNCKIYKKII